MRQSLRGRRRRLYATGSKAGHHGEVLIHAKHRCYKNRHHSTHLGPESVLSLGGLSRLDAIDTREQLALADAADSHLLRMVVCVACATLTLALVSSLA